MLSPRAPSRHEPLQQTPSGRDPFLPWTTSLHGALAGRRLAERDGRGIAAAGGHGLAAAGALRTRPARRLSARTFGRSGPMSSYPGTSSTHGTPRSAGCASIRSNAASPISPCRFLVSIDKAAEADLRVVGVNQQQAVESDVSVDLVDRLLHARRPSAGRSPRRTCAPYPGTARGAVTPEPIEQRANLLEARTEQFARASRVLEHDGAGPASGQHLLQRHGDLHLGLGDRLAAARADVHHDPRQSDPIGPSRRDAARLSIERWRMPGSTAARLIRYVAWANFGRDLRLADQPTELVDLFVGVLRRLPALRRATGRSACTRRPCA